jgi:hypothetical protein
MLIRPSARTASLLLSAIDPSGSAAASFGHIRRKYRMPASKIRLTALLATLLLSSLGSTSAADNRFCGGAATPGDPTDMANAVGDQTLEYAAQQPAGIISCSKGYLLTKCGDHESAHKVFDKCIAAGYVGAMIWKALLLEEGAGVAQDSAKAAELLHRAALSADPAYGPIGKMHYATVLYLGRGVAKNEPEARKWFEAAAAEGNEEARVFLKTGYHTGHRELNALGAGTPTAAALAGAPTGDNASLPRAAQALSDTARTLLSEAPTTPAGSSSTPLADEIQGQKLDRREHAVSSTAPSSLPTASAGLGMLLLGAFLAGIIGQNWRNRRRGSADAPLSLPTERTQSS